MKKLLTFLLESICEKKDFTIEETEGDGRVDFQIQAAPENIGLIIGKNGRTIKAIQNIMRVRARLEKTSVFIGVSEAGTKKTS